MAIVNYENLPSENTPLTGGATGNLNVMQENGTSHGTDTKLGYAQSFLNEHIINVSTEVDDDYRVNLLKSKNLFDVSTLQRNKWLNVNGTISGSADPNIVSAFIKVKNGKQYIFSGIPSTFTLRVCSYTNTSTNSFKTCLINNVNNIKTFTADADYIVFAIGSGDATTLNEIQLEEGNEATTYSSFIQNQIVVDNEKYSDTLNVGASVDSRSRVNVLHSKNLFDEEFRQGSENDTTATGYIFTKNNFVLKAGTYTFSNDLGSSYQYAIFGKTSPFPNSSSAIYNSNWKENNLTFTISQDLYIAIIIRKSDSSNITPSSVSGNKLMLNEGSTALPYEPYITPSIYVDNEEIYNQNIMNYSTNETRIGTWIDGKPLYRITSILTEITTTNTETSKLLPPTNVDKVVKIEGYFYQSSSSSYREINYFNPATNQCNFCTSTIVSNRIQLNLRSSWQVVPYITAYYTKTTD